MNTKLYDIAIKKLKEENIKCICNMDKPLLTISNAYPGVWLEHVYDSIMYAKLFNDTSIAKNTINAFIDLSRNGHIPYAIKNNGDIGYSQIQECVSFTHLSYVLYEMTNDKELLLKVYNNSKKWVDWLYKYRMTLNLGLIEAFVGYDTGHDNSNRLNNMKYKTNYTINNIKQDASIKPDDNPVIMVDMNCNLYSTLITLSKIALLFNNNEEHDKYKNMAIDIKKRLFELCYDKDDSFFYDINSDLTKRRIKSSAIFHLFLENVLDKNDDKKIIEEIYNKHIKNKNEFWTNYPFPSMALCDVNKENIMPNSWGYYSQSLVALRCSLWMDYYGFSSDYDYILGKWIEGIESNYIKYPFSQELDPNTGISSGASEWYSTSMLLYIYACNRLTKNNL